QRLHTMEVRDPRPVWPRVRTVSGLQLPVTHDVLPVARDSAIARYIARKRRRRLELRGGDGVLSGVPRVLDPLLEMVALNSAEPSVVPAIDGTVLRRRAVPRPLRPPHQV